MRSATANALLLLGFAIGILDASPTTAAVNPKDGYAAVTDEGRSAAGYSDAQRSLIEFGLGRFEEQGMSLPEIRFEFFGSTADCRGRKGLYWAETGVLRVCVMDRELVLHELAHAWANQNMSREDRQAFAELRDLDNWNDPERDWENRATEHAAEMITWALMDEPSHVRFVETSEDGATVASFRLLTIPDSEVETLCTGFRELTGQDPIFRTAAGCDSRTLEARWQIEIAKVSSPEAVAG